MTTSTTMSREERENLEGRIQVLLYGIVDEFNSKVEELGKEQAQYCVLGNGADKIADLFQSLFTSRDNEWREKIEKIKLKYNKGYGYTLDRANHGVMGDGYNQALNDLLEQMEGEK